VEHDTAGDTIPPSVLNEIAVCQDGALGCSQGKEAVDQPFDMSHHNGFCGRNARPEQDARGQRETETIS